MEKPINTSFSLESLADTSTYQAGITQSTTQRLLKKFTDDCLREHSLTSMQWFLVGTIYDAGYSGLSITSLSKIADTNVPYITNTLNKLQVKGIIVRKPGSAKDSRTKIVKIHPDYIKTVQAIEQNLRQKMRGTLYSNVTNQELRTYITVLIKFTKSLEKYK